MIKKTCENCVEWDGQNCSWATVNGKLRISEKACSDWKPKPDQTTKDCDNCLHGKRLSDAHDDENGYYDIECIIADGIDCCLNNSFRSWKPKADKSGDYVGTSEKRKSVNNFRDVPASGSTPRVSVETQNEVNLLNLTAEMERLWTVAVVCEKKGYRRAVEEMKQRIKNWNYQKMLADQLIVLGKIEQELNEMEEEKI